MSNVPFFQTREAARRAIRELDDKFEQLLEEVAASPGAGKQRLEKLDQYTKERNTLTKVLFDLCNGDPPNQV